jgi:hypothetical protein
MEALLTYRGKKITQEDVVFIRGLIAQNPEDSRRSLSQILCQAWNWRQPNGTLRDMVCRGLMLVLHRADYIGPETESFQSSGLQRKTRSRGH